MREAPETVIAAEGLQYLRRDARLACRPQRHSGESLEEFHQRIAHDYGVNPADVAEIYGNA